MTLTSLKTFLHTAWHIQFHIFIEEVECKINLCWCERCFHTLCTLPQPFKASVSRTLKASAHSFTMEGVLENGAERYNFTGVKSRVADYYCAGFSRNDNSEFKSIRLVVWGSVFDGDFWLEFGVMLLKIRQCTAEVRGQFYFGELTDHMLGGISHGRVNCMLTCGWCCAVAPAWGLVSWAGGWAPSGHPAGGPASPGSPVECCEPTPALAPMRTPVEREANTLRYCQIMAWSVKCHQMEAGVDVPSGPSCCRMSAFVQPTERTYRDPPLCALLHQALRSERQQQVKSLVHTIYTLFGVLV